MIKAAIRDRAQQGKISACISPQNMAEFFTFMTRKGGRGLEQPLDPEEAADEVRKYLDSEHIMMIFPTPATWPLLLDSLLKERPTAGLAIHDLHLAATMLSNGVKKIYTFNGLLTAFQKMDIGASRPSRGRQVGASRS